MFKKREGEIAAQEEAFSYRISEQANEQATIAKQKDSLLNELSVIQLSLDEKLAELESVKRHITANEEIRAELLAKKSEILKANQTTANLNNTKLTLENEIAGLAVEAEEAQKRLGKLLRDVQEATDNLMQQKLIFETEIKSKNDKLSQLDTIIAVKRAEYATFDTETERVRKDLADRQRQQDDRDQNLRIREKKVEQNEAAIQQNANLLNL